MAGTWILFGCIMVTALLLLLMGVRALQLETPMHFWSGTEVPPEDITDVPAYNRANAMMWLVYGGVFTCAACLSFLSALLAGLAVILLVVAGLPALVVTYEYIYKKYGKKK